jgi:hypothetical protein
VGTEFHALLRNLSEITQAEDLKTPLSVRMAPFQFMKVCSPPALLINSCPGLKKR